MVNTYFFTTQNVLYLPYAGEALNYKQLKDVLTGRQNGAGDIYWVDTKIIEKLKPKELKKERKKLAFSMNGVV